MAETNPNPDREENNSPSSSEQAPIGKTAGEDAPPSTVEEQAPSIVSENLHSTSEPVATDLPTANAPDPKTVNPETAPSGAPETEAQAGPNPPDAGSSKSAAKKAAAPPKADKPADKAAAKKEKAPAVEDKPFADFIQQHYLPSVKKALADQGVKNLDLAFTKQKIPINGYNDDCWQIIGRWQNGAQHQFNLYFPEENIQGQRAFSCNEGSKPSTLEPFLIDERKVTLDLMIYGLVQRLNGQKWLARN